MSRVLVLLYGVVAFLAVFAAAVAFVGNVGQARGIDGGERGAIAVSLAIEGTPPTRWRTKGALS